MLRAVPLMTFTAASISRQFMSAFFISAISSTCFRVTFPTRSRPGSLEPEANPAIFLRRMEAGGDFVMMTVDKAVEQGLIDGARPNDEASIKEGSAKLRAGLNRVLSPGLQGNGGGT